jgi:hypothetical protein
MVRLMPNHWHVRVGNMAIQRETRLGAQTTGSPAQGGTTHPWLALLAACLGLFLGQVDTQCQRL